MSYLVVLAIFVLFFLLLGSISMGFLIGSCLGNYGYGFLIVTAFYLLLLIIFVLCKTTIQTHIMNLSIATAFKKINKNT